MFCGILCDVRADRLVSLVLLLRQRGRLSAREIAAELEVSVRTVLRDVEALSGAGVPVYAERGRHGGFALLPGFRTELSGLSQDEALALLTSGPRHSGQAFGLGSAFAAALRKVVDALPQTHRETLSDATRRFLVEPESDLLSRRRPVDDVSGATMTEVRVAVLAGRKLRIQYEAPGRPATWRTVDPLGLVTVRDRTYLLAMKHGADRTYRLSRILAATALPEPAERPADVDLDELWRDRTARFLADGHLTVQVRVAASRQDELLASVRAVRAVDPEPDGGWVRLTVAFEDLRHAEWAVWQLGTDAEALAPGELRDAITERATSLVRRYARSSSPEAD